jgi:hypothetical protein
MTIFWLRDNFVPPLLTTFARGKRDTAPVPFLSFVYRDYFPAVYLTCTATPVTRFARTGQARLHSRKFAPGRQKARHTCLATGTIFWLKYRDSYRRTAPPTFTPSTAGPLGVRGEANAQPVFIREFYFNVTVF